MKTKYLLTSRAPCPTCEGTGDIQHPAWVAYYGEYDGLPKKSRRQFWNNDRAWFRAHGCARIPPDEIPCPDCEGTGTLTQVVTLREALREINSAEWDTQFQGRACQAGVKPVTLHKLRRNHE